MTHGTSPVLYSTLCVPYSLGLYKWVQKVMDTKRKLDYYIQILITPQLHTQIEYELDYIRV